MNLTPFGIFHTALSLVAVISAAVSLIRHRGIEPASVSGRIYLVSLIATSVTGLFIFRHGTLTPPHGLSVLVLSTLLVAAIANRSRLFGQRSIYVSTFALSFTVLLLSISAVTETLTRLPVSAPLVSSPESPALQPLYGLLLLAFASGVTLQIRSQRRRHSAYLAAPTGSVG